MAFTQNTTPTMVKQPQNGKVQIVAGDTTTKKTVYTAGASGSKVNALMAASADTVARDVQISINNGATDYVLGTVTVPIGAGNSGSVNAVNLMNEINMPGLPIDSDGNPYIFLISGDILRVNAVATVSGTVHVVANVGDF